MVTTGPSDPSALISAVGAAGGGGGAGGTATMLMVTESLVLSAPSVQSRVRVTELPTSGYHG